MDSFLVPPPFPWIFDPSRGGGGSGPEEAELEGRRSSCLPASPCLAPLSAGAGTPGLRPVHVPRIHRAQNPVSRFLGGIQLFMGNPPLIQRNLFESNPLQSRFLVRGLAAQPRIGKEVVTRIRRSKNTAEPGLR